MVACISRWYAVQRQHESSENPVHRILWWDIYYCVGVCVGDWQLQVPVRHNVRKFARWFDCNLHVECLWSTDWLLLLTLAVENTCFELRAAGRLTAAAGVSAVTTLLYNTSVLPSRCACMHTCFYAFMYLCSNCVCVRVYRSAPWPEGKVIVGQTICKTHRNLRSVITVCES